MVGGGQPHDVGPGKRGQHLLTGVGVVVGVAGGLAAAVVAGGSVTGKLGAASCADGESGDADADPAVAGAVVAGVVVASVVGPTEGVPVCDDDRPEPFPC